MAFNEIKVALEVDPSSCWLLNFNVNGAVHGNLAPTDISGILRNTWRWLLLSFLSPSSEPCRVPCNQGSIANFFDSKCSAPTEEGIDRINHLLEVLL
ncbi:hypothetical protein GOBAR_DD07577 [Gossypium barbadense]|nr:hypothetical protein GOBAR_DD07577 [Gossypium barbadense]